jgi:hypothetical protein
MDTVQPYPGRQRRIGAPVPATHLIAEQPTKIAHRQQLRAVSHPSMTHSSTSTATWPADPAPTRQPQIGSRRRRLDRPLAQAILTTELQLNL